MVKKQSVQESLQELELEKEEGTEKTNRRTDATQAEQIQASTGLRENILRPAAGFHTARDLFEILDDWRWIFSYSRRYKGAIVFYTLIGILSTTLGLITSVASKYLIDIITGYQMDKLGTMALIVVTSSLISLVFSNLVKRYSARLSIGISNDIQADIYDKIMDARWSDIIRYRNGDILNRFNSDVGTVSSNAISWLPSVILAVYKFAATFLGDLAL